MKLSGIYKIESLIKPDRCYIGSSIDIFKRWEYHKQDLRNNRHRSPKLQNHVNKYGEGDLQFSILLGCNKADLIKIEQYFIDYFNPYFNICKIAGSQLGAKRTQESKERMSNAQKKLYASGYTNPHKGEKLNSERIAQMKKDHSIAILQYDKNMNLINEWDSAAEAGQNGFIPSNIAACLKNKRPYHRNFIWRYK